MTIFLTAVVRVFASWAVKTDFAQALMQNMTKAEMEMDKIHKNTGEAGKYKVEL